MRSSDWDVIAAARTEPRGFLWGFMTCNAWWALIIVLASCTAALIPSGVPTCPNRTAWSDSAQRCLPRDAAKGEG